MGAGLIGVAFMALVLAAFVDDLTVEFFIEALLTGALFRDAFLSAVFLIAISLAMKPPGLLTGSLTFRLIRGGEKSYHRQAHVSCLRDLPLQVL